VATAARTGKIGDGKIFVFEVGEAVRIRNDDRGNPRSRSRQTPDMASSESSSGRAVQERAKSEFYDAHAIVLAWRTARSTRWAPARFHECLTGCREAVAIRPRQLFPFSDIELMLLFESDGEVEKIEEGPDAVPAAAVGFRASRQPVRCGLRRVLELHDQNIELNISLLDVAFLTGERGIADLLNPGWRAWCMAAGRTWCGTWPWLTRDRHLKFNDTIYHLEPNIRDAGGLRDSSFSAG